MGNAYQNVPVGSAFNDKQTRDTALYTVLSYYEQAVDPVSVDAGDGPSLMEDLTGVMEQIDAIGYVPPFDPRHGNKLNETLDRAYNGGMVQDTVTRTGEGYVITDRGRVTAHEVRHADHDRMTVDDAFAERIDAVIADVLGSNGCAFHLE